MCKRAAKRSGQFNRSQFTGIHKSVQTSITVRFTHSSKMRKILQGSHPNTYTLTKSIAEQIAADYHHRLPICIIRPSIVTAALHEPFPGWVDNINGITGIMMEISRGTITSIMCDKNLVMDLIPVDIVCNTMIAAAWMNYFKP